MMGKLVKYVCFALLGLSFLISCQKGDSYSYFLKRGEIHHGPLTPYSFIDDLDNNAHSELINVEIDTTYSYFEYRIRISDLESSFVLHSEPIWAEFEDLKVFDLTGNGRKEVIYTYQNVDSLFLT